MFSEQSLSPWAAVVCSAPAGCPGSIGGVVQGRVADQGPLHVHQPQVEEEGIAGLTSDRLGSVLRNYSTIMQEFPRVSLVGTVESPDVQVLNPRSPDSFPGVHQHCPHGHVS